MSVTHIGKIGRLPKSIRNELGQRIEDGEPGKELVKWLNGLSNVKSTSRNNSADAPLPNKPLRMEANRSSRVVAASESVGKRSWMTERADDLENEADGMEISDRLGSILAAELASLAEKLLEEVPDPRERWQRFQEVLREFRHFRHEDHNGERNQLQRQRWEREVERQDEEDLKREEKKQRSPDWRMFQPDAQPNHRRNALAAASMVNNWPKCFTASSSICLSKT